ncbi:hypothetical protein ACFOSC_05125 [Streptantibioticus rubrisoli]|uniref:Integral membrane protein n=1 Tax=Streptantibioticus rubrisoli TaxID=1387313 RepID=A0ABT1PG65_9ACTN|nr:hypothetical protein [Streptantibioticus rubrisoli]MCQ4044362.1 hypothetical protein [Streptantibioticus rubrisoli]
MGRGAYALARVAVMVRMAARWCWWLGVLAAVAGAFVPGFTGRRIGALGGAVVFLVAAVAAFLTRRGRYTALAGAATHAAKSAFLQDRSVTARQWLRPRGWWLLLAFALAVGSSAAASAAGGMLLAGVGAGLWAKALWLGRWERSHEALLWVRPEQAMRRGPAGRDVRAYLTTGPAAGDARPGGARRVVSSVR